jgi:hypothetical protein
MIKQTESTTDKYLGDFYDTKAHITSIYRSAKSAHEAGNVEYAEKLLAGAKGTKKAYSIMNKANARMSKMNGAIREIEGDRSLSQAEKRAKITPIIKQRNELSRQVMDVIREIEEKQGTTFKRAS